MVITHSYLQPDGYAGTHETADDLISFIGIHRRVVDEAGLNGMRIISRAGRGNFHVFGFAGTTGKDHKTHLQNMRFGFRMLAKTP
jgi:hypothetical protein